MFFAFVAASDRIQAVVSVFEKKKCLPVQSHFLTIEYKTNNW